MAFVNDTFTGESDGTGLNSHTGETGATWTDSFGGSGGIVCLASGRVYSNGVSVATHKASGTPASPDYSVSVDVKPQSQATLFECGCSGRLIAAGTYYRASYSTTSAEWQLYKFVGHTPTSLGTFGQVLTNGNTYNCKLDMVGTTIRLLVDGVQRISVTDSSVTLAGVAAIYIHLGSATTGLHADNFSASDPSSSSVSPSVSPSVSRSPSPSSSTSASLSPSASVSPSSSVSRSPSPSASVSPSSSVSASQSPSASLSPSSSVSPTQSPSASLSPSSSASPSPSASPSVSPSVSPSASVSPSSSPSPSLSPSASVSPSSSPSPTTSPSSSVSPSSSTSASPSPSPEGPAEDVIVQATGPIIVEETTGVYVKDPNETVVAKFDWNYNGAMAEGVHIDTSTFTVEAIHPAADSALVITDVSPLGIQSSGRVALVKLSGGTLYGLYRIHHTITTNETPAQTRRKSFLVLIEMK